MNERPIYLVGAGAVGSVIAAGLIRAGRSVTLIIRPEDQARYAQRTELRVRHSNGGADWVVPAPPYQTDYAMPAESVLLIAVKHRGLESVIDALVAQSQQPQDLVSCLNGVNAVQRLARHLPRCRISALTVMFNAQLLDTLQAQITTDPELLLQTQSDELRTLLSSPDWDLSIAENAAVAWGKLLINLANALCALTHTTFKDLLIRPAMRASFVATLDEATSVLARANLRYRLPIPLPYWAYRLVLLHGGLLAWQAAKRRNGLTAQSYPSMVADVAQGKPTEVEELNGEIVRLAQTLGVAAPVNQRICQLIQTRTEDPHSSPMSAEQLLRELQQT